MGSTPERMTVSYPSELSMLDRCADLQGGHWTIHGSASKHVGPASHYEVIDNLIPEMEEDIELERQEVEQEQGPSEANSANTRFYVDIRRKYKMGRLRCPPLDGVRYCHPDFDDANFLDSYRGHPSPEYPREGTPKYRAGGDLNKVLRHCIGKVDRKYTGEYPLKCDEGAWVLIEDLIQYDNIWHDGYDYCGAIRDNDRIKANTIRKQRVGWIVDLTVAESNYKGKVRFQIQALRATCQDDVVNIVNQKIIPPPIPGTDMLAPPYFGWIMPIAVRATSGCEPRVDLKPELIMRRLTLKTAWKLKGAFHVTSPTHLVSILKHGIVPGGEKQRRLMSFFGVFPPWDERNRVTRTRSPIEGEPHMLIIYILPTELIRYGAGVSSTGDIMVPESIPPEEIREIWLARSTNLMTREKSDGSSPDLSKSSRSSLPMKSSPMQTSKVSEDLESLPQDFS